ncbi:hypothetical protein EFV64_09685 [Yersinia enterocolitica]|nr:hypothetical protein [Yersinia enterocolitica]
MRTYTRHLSTCCCVGCTRLPESLTSVSSSGCTPWPPCCKLKAIGYFIINYSNLINGFLLKRLRSRSK